MSFVDQRVVDSPGVGQVPLLEPQVVVVSETGKVGAGLFKGIVGLKLSAIIEVVVGGEALVIVDSVVEAKGKLIRIVGSHRNRFVSVGAGVGRGHELLQKIGSDGILAGAGNHAVGKHARVLGPARGLPVNRGRSRGRIGG